MDGTVFADAHRIDVTSIEVLRHIVDEFVFVIFSDKTGDRSFETTAMDATYALMRLVDEVAD